MRTIVIVIALALCATPAFALKIYHLQGNQYAIICNDGIGYSFSGSANGAQEAGALLCNEHGGVANITNTLSANQALKKMDATRKRPGRTKGAVTAPAAAGTEYIHKPDSTMYHPSRGAAAAAAPGSRYIHKPDSTMYHPHKAGSATPGVSGLKYIHRPDSTMYHPQKQNK